jgi:hypothetical protein
MRFQVSVWRLQEQNQELRGKAPVFEPLASGLFPGPSFPGVDNGALAEQQDDYLFALFPGPPAWSLGHGFFSVDSIFL